MSRVASQTFSAASNVKPPEKTAKPGEELLLFGRAELVAPFDRRPQRLLPRREVAPRAGQHRQPPVEPGEQLAGRQDLHPGRGQLDRERQAVEPPADLGQPAVVGREPRQHGLRALPEELDRRSLGQRPQRKLALAGDPQRLAARRQDAEVRACAQQPGDLAGGFDDLLEVVENE